MEVIPEYAKTTYRAKIDAHIEELRSRTRAAGMDYHLLVTINRLMQHCANIFRCGRRGTDGLSGAMVSGGLAALGVPVFVHLLRKHVTTPRPVSSLMFFERGTQSSTRHQRLRYLLLFALRSALLLLVVLAFADPFVRLATTGAKDTCLLIVLDNSFSMRAGNAIRRSQATGTYFAGREASVAKGANHCTRRSDSKC